MSDKNTFRQRICEGCGMPIYSDGLCAHCEPDASTDKLPEWVMVPLTELARIYKEAHVAEFERLEPITRPDYPGRMQANADAAIEAGLRAVMAEIAAAPPREVVVDEAIERLADDDHSVEFYRATNHGGDKLWLVAIRNSDTDNADEYEGDTLQEALAAALTHPQGEES